MYRTSAQRCASREATFPLVVNAMMDKRIHKRSQSNWKGGPQKVVELSENQQMEPTKEYITRKLPQLAAALCDYSWFEAQRVLRLQEAVKLSEVGF
jgi:hypothetical protein